MRKKKTYKKPNPIVYFIFRICSKIICKFKLNLKNNRNELKNVKGSYLLIANHESVIDFVSLGAFAPKMSLVVSSSFFNTLPIQNLMKIASVIPKQQFQTTPTDLKRMKEVLDNGMPLGIYPAGLMSEQGLATPIPESTGKFIKWLKQDVYVAKIKGTYLSKPKWSKVWRKGASSFDIYKLIDKDKLEELSGEEVYNLINNELYFDAYKDQEENKIEFINGDNIIGLEAVLYKCPKCHKEFTMISKEHNILTCSACGNSCKADNYGFLNKINDNDIIYKHPSDWALDIENELKNEIENNKDFELKDDCEIHLLNQKKRRYEFAYNAKITLNNKLLVIETEDNRKEILSYQYVSLPFSPNHFFEIQDGKITYRIKLKNRIATTKWVWALKALYQIKLKENKVLQK